MDYLFKGHPMAMSALILWEKIHKTYKHKPRGVLPWPKVLSQDNECIGHMAMETIRPTNIDQGNEYLLGVFVFLFCFVVCLLVCFLLFLFLFPLCFLKYFLSLGLNIMCSYLDFGQTCVKNS